MAFEVFAIKSQDSQGMVAQGEWRANANDRRVSIFETTFFNNFIKFGLRHTKILSQFDMWD